MRETGTKMVAFSADEIDQLDLTFERDIGAAVKSRLAPKKTASSEILSLLPNDVREFIVARADGLGVAPDEVITEQMRDQMTALMNPGVSK